tara:strand:+ start:423 stop:1160 length:738 start_codon:yes stop_codon:yes gene_type:complete
VFNHIKEVSVRFYRSIRPIKAVSLDLDDTLWDNRPVIAKAEAALLKHLETHQPDVLAILGTEGIQQRRSQLLHDHPELHLDLSAFRRHLLQSIFGEFGHSPDEVEQAFQVYYHHRQQVTLYPGANALLEHLSARYPLIAISNGNADLHQIGLTQYFKADIRPHSVGVRKPDQRLYQKVEQQLDIPTNQILHIGDHLHYDVYGAYLAGMQTLWMNHGQHNLFYSRNSRIVPHAEAYQLEEVQKWLV